MSRNYIIAIGSKKFFFNLVKGKNEQYSFQTLIKASDAAITDGNRRFPKELQVDLLIVNNDCYHSITEQAHDMLGRLIEEFTSEDATIYIHNPPQTLMKYIEANKAMGLCDYIVKREKYSFDDTTDDFVNNIAEIEEAIIGQQHAVMEMVKSMWYLLHTTRKNPYVVMLYGGSSIGKTELVRQIAKQFYKGAFLEKHLSMFKNENYADYFFGEKPNRKSLGYDLLERESNLVFLDELDKCPDYFYSAFYTLFDNEVFQDASYSADISSLLIVVTSNYNSEEEMKKSLGLPVYYRIDKFIHFEEFDATTIYKITVAEIKRKIAEISVSVDFNEIYNVVSKQIMLTGENGRTIKQKVQKAIEEETFSTITDEYNHRSN